MRTRTRDAPYHRVCGNFWTFAYHFLLAALFIVGSRAEIDDHVRRSLFRTEEEEARWLRETHEKEHKYIKRELSQATGKVDVIIHYGHSHQGQFKRTHAEAVTLTEDEYNEINENKEQYGIVLIEFDALATDQTFVTGSLDDAHMQINTNIDSEQITSWGVDHLTKEWEQLSPFNSGETGRTINLCVIDSGLFMKHNDLDYWNKDDPMVVGAEFNVGSAKWHRPLAPAWHGTHIAGIVCADSGNGMGARGLIPDCRSKIRLMVARVFDNSHFATAKMSDVDHAVEWCADNGADIINLSLASLKPSYNSMMIYRDIALNKPNCLVVAAAGNGGPDERRAYPASYHDVISVGAVDFNHEIAPFSQKGADIVAPGKGIFSLSTEYAVKNKDTSGVSATVPMVFSASPEDPVEAPTCDCGFAQTPCDCLSEPSICIIERTWDIPVDVQVENAQNGDCVGALIFSQDDTNAYGDGFDFLFQSSIPCVYVKEEEATTILQKGGNFLIDFGFPNFRVADGTSQAAPHAAGIIAMLMMHRDHCTAEQIRRACESSAESLPGDPDLYGAGLIQVVPAYMALLNEAQPCGDPVEAALFSIELASLNGEDPWSLLTKRTPSEDSFDKDVYRVRGNSGRQRGSTGTGQRRGYRKR